MRLKLYMNKETARLFRIVSPASDGFMTLSPVSFAKTSFGGYKIMFIRGAEGSGYDMLRKLYEPFTARTPTKFENSINNVEIVEKEAGDIIWFIPLKLFSKYMDGYEICDDNQ